MKTIPVSLLIIYFFFANSSNFFAQNWLEGTPSWEHGYDWDCVFVEIGHDRILYEKDTMIAGRAMKKF
ncbi:MAG: hypothetical protein AB8G15_09760 [Saprospiraceae bacterium]